MYGHPAIWFALWVGSGSSSLVLMGEPKCVCGCAWAERLESKLMSLTDVLEAVTDLTIVAWSAASPRALVHGEVVAILGPRANEGISSELGMVAAGADRPLGRLRVYPYQPDIFNGIASPRG
jgi:hypothetical protein